MRGPKDDTGKELTEAEKRRLERFNRRRASKSKNRKTPALIPNRLVRTSAFAAREIRLARDANFRRTYFLEGHSVVEVIGGELGTQHRDALYAIFRLNTNQIQVETPIDDGQGGTRKRTVYQTATTWRELLTTMGKTHHVNNMGTVQATLEDMQTIVIKVYEGTYEQWVAVNADQKRSRATGAGFSENIITRIDWEGLTLDSAVVVEYGAWVRQMFEKRALAALDTDSYFKLRSDYAKSFWPFLDSQREVEFIDEPRLAELVDFDFAHGDRGARSGFRRECRHAFEDMVRVGALSEWRYEALGDGRKKVMRYFYRFAPRPGEGVQLTLALDAPGAPQQPAEDAVP